MRIALLIGTLLAVPVSAMAGMDTYDFDSTHTYPHFTINHLGFSTMHGRFNATTGTFQLDLAGKKGAVDVTIDAASVDTGFKKRDDHLRSPDFLNVVEYPQINYKSTKVSFASDTTATVEGNLTIMGVSKPVTLNITNIHCAMHPMAKKDTCGFEANATIKRSDFGVKYGLPNIGDEMQLVFEAEGFKK